MPSNRSSGQPIAFFLSERAATGSGGGPYRWAESGAFKNKI
jgi:hypothetical protein